MADANRLSSSARALAGALDTLADALARVQPDAVVAAERALETRREAFRAASDAAVVTGDGLTACDAYAITFSLARCRRLGGSLALFASCWHTTPQAPTLQGRVGRLVPRTGDGRPSELLNPLR